MSLKLSKRNRKYVFFKQPYDEKDNNFSELVKLKDIQIVSLPSMVNNRFWCSAVEDQGQLGSCTANAWAGLLQFNECKNGLGGKSYKDLSRLFIYYNERVIEGDVSQDNGATLRDGSQTLTAQGVCPESQWPYNINNFAVKPTTQCYTNALPYKISGSYALTTLNDMKTCLADGRCFVFGFNVYDYFESDQMASTGILYLPQPSENLLGGHACLAVGYNDTQQRFLIKNSWGKGWGLPNPVYDGYFTMPYAYMTNPELASDFWTATNV